MAEMLWQNFLELFCPNQNQFRKFLGSHQRVITTLSFRSVYHFCLIFYSVGVAHPTNPTSQFGTQYQEVAQLVRAPA